MDKPHGQGRNRHVRHSGTPKARRALVRNYVRAIWRKLCQNYEDSLLQRDIFDVQAWAETTLTFEAYKQNNSTRDCLTQEEVEKASCWVVAAHVSRTSTSDNLCLNRFGHERYVARLQQLGIWSSEKAADNESDDLARENEAAVSSMDVAVATRTLKWADALEEDDSAPDHPPILTLPWNQRMRQLPAATLTPPAAAAGGGDDVCVHQAKLVLEREHLKKAPWVDLAFEVCKEVSRQVLGGRDPSIRFFGSRAYQMDNLESDIDIVANLPQNSKLNVEEFLTNCAAVLVRMRCLSASLGVLGPRPSAIALWRRGKLWCLFKHQHFSELS